MSTIRHGLLVFLCLFCFHAMVAQETTNLENGVTLGPDMSTMLNTVPLQEDPMTVILTFNETAQATQARKILQEKDIEFRGPEFVELPIQGIHATPATILSLSDLPGLIGIWNNRKMHTELHQALIVSSVSDVRTDAEFATLNDGLDITGRGVGVLVNDSGFDGDDSDIQATEEAGFNVRIVQNVKGTGVGEWAEDFGADTDQGGGHGSHCMGIIGGDGRHSNGKITGVAPGAQLIGYGSGAGLFILDTGGGFEYVAQHKRDYNIRVMSNSFGTTSDTTFMSFNPTAPLSVATRALTESGVIVVFSAGNSGPTEGKITGVYKTSPWVICVGNGTKDGGLAGSSSRGRQDPAGMHPSMRDTVTVGGTEYLWENRPTVTAPGTDIVSVRSTLGALGPLAALEDANLEPSEIPYYTTLSGTSMACPHVAGIVALMLEANPNLEWRAVKAILQRTAIDNMPGETWERGEGYVNAWAAVAAAFNGLCDAAPGATYEQLYGLPSDGSFGFDSDAWRTCPLNAEVTDRIKASVPLPSGVEVLCAPGAPTITDDTGVSDADMPPADYFDIEEVTFTNETETTFDINLKVNNNLALSPAGTAELGTRNYYDVHFTLTKPVSEDPSEEATPDITYIVSAYDILTTKNFKLTARANDGTTRPNTGTVHYDDITGVWNTVTNTITWTVPKASLDVSTAPPGTGTATSGTRTSRGAKIGDILKRWESYTYERVGTATPDGAGVYHDTADGDCFKELEVE